MSDEQMGLDFGDVALTPIERRVPPGPVEWRHWFQQMPTQLNKFGSVTIRGLPQPVWSAEAVERVAQVFDDLFPDVESVRTPADPDLVDQFLRWFGECSIHNHPGQEWCYLPEGPALRDADDVEGHELTTVRSWLEYAAEFGFDHVRFLFRPDDDTDEADDDAYAREQQQRQAAAAAEYQRLIRAVLTNDPGSVPASAWAKWAAPQRRARQVREFLNKIGWPELPDHLWADSGPEVDRIQQLLTEWFPTRAAMTNPTNAEHADQVVCFLGECMTRYAGAVWFDRRQHEDMHLVYGGEKAVLSLYDEFEPGLAVTRSDDRDVPPFTYVAGELLPRAVANFADMTRFVRGLSRCHMAGLDGSR
ncbi:hypothetical protein [Nocardia nova]|uniref:hypothetical protein n=1 Tax=Nocardia nova TaxID=37330 RepID=UPI0011B04259|nr:hypothetical protein [Nocardia nova]